MKASLNREDEAKTSLKTIEPWERKERWALRLGRAGCFEEAAKLCVPRPVNACGTRGDKDIDLEGQKAHGLVGQSEQLGGIPREMGCHRFTLGGNPIPSLLVKAPSGDHVESTGGCRHGGGTPVRRPSQRCWADVVVHGVEWGWWEVGR